MIVRVDILKNEMERSEFAPFIDSGCLQVLTPSPRNLAPEVEAAEQCEQPTAQIEFDQ